MKVTSIQPADDCVDSSMTQELRLDSPLTREVIECLGQFGSLEFHRSFARPLFHLVIDNRIHIKGIEGNRSCVVMLDRDDPDGSLRRVRAVFEDALA